MDGREGEEGLVVEKKLSDILFCVLQ